ncbi:hypothetical protein GCM10023168_28610 [Fodinibacter luteus]|uniref:Inosine/uridine-preferring nucleoside hydrolase domain-containing protein n=1 Tax=Fodinibacter luteus TaxID=552064 RepID=A0ABP8KLQ1_9MICO
MKRATAVAFLASCAVLAGCSAPADLDGETTEVGLPLGPTPTAAPGQDPTPLVVDTDLGADDLLALTFLLRHPDVHVRAITITATGFLDCDTGLDVLGGLISALDASPPPVACGRSNPGPGARSFPAAWAAAAATGSGITPDAGALTASPEPAAQLIAGLAQSTQGLVLVALGPLTNVADVAMQHPQDYAKLAAVHAMAGSVSGPIVDGVAEWNAAADPAALQTVLGAHTPLTLVPEDAVPQANPDTLTIPAARAVIAASTLPAWWDLAAVAALVAPQAGRAQTAQWVLHPTAAGRLVPDGDGPVRVVRSLDGAVLEAEYARVSASG